MEYTWLKQRLYVLGLIILLMILLFNPWTALFFSSRFSNPAEMYRVWGLDVFLGVVGSGLVSIKYRNKLRTLSDLFIGLLITAILLLMLETVFFWLNSGNPSASHGYYSAQLYELSPELGFQNKLNVIVQSVQYYNDEVVYSVTHTTDEFGRRITPVRSDQEQFILFMGDSFTFGWGVEDEETLPYQVATLATDYAVYNYGVNAYGTSHLLAKLEQGHLGQEVHQTRGLLIYTFIDGHVGRNIGTFKIHTSRGHHYPYYNSKLERQGDMISGRPFLSVVYGLMGVSQVVKYLDLDFPEITNEDYRFTSKLISKAQQEFKQQFPENEFYVLLFPKNGQKLIPYLQQEGVKFKYLDYSQLLGDKAEYWIPHDGHPTMRAYSIVAEQLVSDLRLTSLNR